MPIPELTHLQFLVLGILLAQEKSGREVRDRMKQHGARLGLAAFYQLMARMEAARLIKGSYEKKVVDGQHVKIRKYKVLGHGVRSYEHTREFNAQVQLEGERGLGGLPAC